jgi:DNA repair protein RadA/Sms
MRPIASMAGPAGALTVPVPLSEVPEQALARTPTGLTPLDEVLGGGLVAGCAIVLGGAAGLGKSQLAMQAAAGLRRRALYATGEESIEQAAGRARRIGAASAMVYVVAETDVDTVIGHAEATRAQLLVVDSIQMVACTELAASAGTPNQVRECAARLVRFAKHSDTCVILIGHVTRDGELGGPATLRHVVDVVLELEAGADDERIVRATKNRFGPTGLSGRLRITGGGLVPLALIERVST